MEAGLLWLGFEVGDWWWWRVVLDFGGFFYAGDFVEGLHFVFAGSTLSLGLSMIEVEMVWRPYAPALGVVVDVVAMWT